eukprot:6369913-Prymnesium_polylepis.2
MHPAQRQHRHYHSHPCCSPRRRPACQLSPQSGAAARRRRPCTHRRTGRTAPQGEPRERCTRCPECDS